MAVLLRQLLRLRAGRRARPRPARARRGRGARVRHRRDPAAARAPVDHDRLGARRGGARVAVSGASRIAACSTARPRCSPPCSSRLALNPEVLLYEPRGALRIFNWYLYAYVICAAALFAAAWWLSGRRTGRRAGLPRVSPLLPAAAVILLFLLLNIEIADFYATGPTIMFRFGATVSQDLTYTIGWLVFGMPLLAAGIYLHNRPARVTALALIAVTTFKCFLYDLSSLGGLYRVASFVGLAFVARARLARAAEVRAVEAEGPHETRGRWFRSPRAAVRSAAAVGGPGVRASASSAIRADAGQRAAAAAVDVPLLSARSAVPRLQQRERDGRRTDGLQRPAAVRRDGSRCRTCCCSRVARARLERRPRCCRSPATKKTSGFEADFGAGAARSIASASRASGAVPQAPPARGQRRPRALDAAPGRGHALRSAGGGSAPDGAVVSTPARTATCG